MIHKNKTMIKYLISWYALKIQKSKRKLENKSLMIIKDCSVIKIHFKNNKPHKKNKKQENCKLKRKDKNNKECQKMPVVKIY